MKEVYKDQFNWWQKVIASISGMWRINRGSIDFKWGYFAPDYGFELMFNRGGYFDQHCSINVCLIWGKLQVKLPFKTKIPESCDTPRYGVQIHNNTFWLHIGGKMNSWEQCDAKWITWDLPFFSWVFDWHKMKLLNGDMVKYSYESRGEAHTEKHPYTYTLSSGVIQNRTATCFVEERQWHRKWLPFIKMNKRVIDVSFDDEVGEESGSWKGGTVGCGYDMNKGETIKGCLARMESERKF